jgi:DNA-binding NtrC family response regulator
MLVVEDDANTRTALRRIFALRGWTVRSAATVAEGLRALDPTPDCLILDLSLPDGNGERILDAVASRGLATRILVISGVSDAARLKQVEERYRPAAVFLKPVNLEQILQVSNPIRQELSGRPSGQAP